MLIVRASPELQKTLVNMIGEAFSTGPMQYVSGAYSNGEVGCSHWTYFFYQLAGGLFCIHHDTIIDHPVQWFSDGWLSGLCYGVSSSRQIWEILSFSKIIIGHWYWFIADF